MLLMNRRDALLGLAGVALVPSMAMASETDFRIIETATGKEVRWKSMLDVAAKSDAVFVGEQHDDPETHRIELAILEDLHARLINLVLAHILLVVEVEKLLCFFERFEE
jgi:uncharacterized iron-regulated protein